jgi:hypothetical protein
VPWDAKFFSLAYSLIKTEPRRRRFEDSPHDTLEKFGRPEMLVDMYAGIMLPLERIFETFWPKTLVRLRLSHIAGFQPFIHGHWIGRREASIGVTGVSGRSSGNGHRRYVVFAIVWSLRLWEEVKGNNSSNRQASDTVEKNAYIYLNASINPGDRENGPLIDVGTVGEEMTLRGWIKEEKKERNKMHECTCVGTKRRS